jgi:hypothetical protein
VCVAPSSPEVANRPLGGFPAKILEYMACRRAVVAPRRSSVAEVISDGTDGLLFEPGSAEDLERAIGRLLGDVSFREAVAESGYQRVRSDYPASATRRRLHEAYLRLLPHAQLNPPRHMEAPIDALPAHQDTTTSRRQWPEPTPEPSSEEDQAITPLGGVIASTPPPAAFDAARTWVRPADWGRTPTTPSGGRSGVIDTRHEDTAEGPTTIAGEVVIEAMDYASAGEAYDSRVDAVDLAPTVALPAKAGVLTSTVESLTPTVALPAKTDPDLDRAVREAGVLTPSTAETLTPTQALPAKGVRPSVADETLLPEGAQADDEPGTLADRGGHWPEDTPTLSSALLAALADTEAVEATSVATDALPLHGEVTQEGPPTGVHSSLAGDETGEHTRPLPPRPRGSGR